jgi:molecular chaperone HtpG
MRNTEQHKEGTLSIEEENLFTILKKWLYSEQDIVFRELVSNAADAIKKRTAQDAQAPDGAITVTVDADNGRIIISDNGIGMTAEEVDRYINKIAFSGASDFIAENRENDTASIIGHFGVGFYSAFMLADRVEIETKSYNDGAAAVKWECGADMKYAMTEGSRTEPGTDVILYPPADSPFLTDPKTVYEILRKYFIFLKVPVRLDAPRNADYDRALVNDTSPVWKKRGLTEDTPEDIREMADFYKEFFDDSMDPLFSVRFASVDIGVSGVIFFRDTKQGTEEIDGTFKIYSRGVFVGENIPALIPKFVNLQSGIIDCDDLPLVVSRSDVRETGENESGDSVTALISETLVQEVTIAMNDLFMNARGTYEAMWPHLNAFVKYSVLLDKTFASVMTRRVIFEDLHGNYYTIAEYRESLGSGPQSKEPVTVYYVTDAVEQAHYIEIFRRSGMNALLFDHVIDQPFLRKQEIVHPNTRFVRIDSDTEALFKGSVSDEDTPVIEALTEKFRHVLGVRLDNYTLRITSLESEAVSALILHDEKSRRMADMLEMYGMINSGNNAAAEMPSGSVLLVNMNNDIIRYVAKADEERANLVIGQLFDVALLSQGALNVGEVENFITRNETLLRMIISH